MEISKPLVLSEDTTVDTDSERDTDNEYLMFRIDSLCTDIAMSTYGTTINAGLGGVQVIDKIHTGEYHENILK